MDNRAYILDLLSRGAGASDVARLASVSPAFISQLQSDPQFAQELAEKRALHAAERDSRANKTQAIHKKYLDLEENLLDKLTIQAKSGLLKPIEQMKLLQIVAAKKEPIGPLDPAAQQGQVQHITQISLPVQIAAQFVLNQNKEIVGTTDGKSFAPMSTRGLQDMANRALPAPKPQMHKSEDILRMFALNPNAEEEIKI